MFCSLVHAYLESVVDIVDVDRSNAKHLCLFPHDIMIDNQLACRKEKRYQ